MVELRTRSRIIRWIVLFNMVVVVTIANSTRGTSLDRMLSRLPDVVFPAVDIWLVGSTLALAVVFLSILIPWRKNNNLAPRFAIVLDGLLTLGWWVALALVCLGAYIKGLGG